MFEFNTVKTVKRQGAGVIITKKNEVEVFISRILPNVKKATIVRAIEREIGKVMFIEICKRKNERGIAFQFAFLRIVINNTPSGKQFREIILKNNKPYFLFYDNSDKNTYVEIKYKIPRSERCYKETVTVRSTYRSTKKSKVLAHAVKKTPLASVASKKPEPVTDLEEGEVEDEDKAEYYYELGYTEDEDESDPIDVEDDEENSAEIYAEFEKENLKRQMAEEMAKQDEQDYQWLMNHIDNVRQMSIEDDEDYLWLERQIFNNNVAVY